MKTSIKKINTKIVAVAALSIISAVTLFAAHSNPAQGGTCATAENGSPPTCSTKSLPPVDCPSGTPVHNDDKPCNSANGTKLYYKVEVANIKDCQTNETQNVCCKEQTVTNGCKKRWYVTCDTRSRTVTCKNSNPAATVTVNDCYTSDPTYDPEGDLDSAVDTPCS
jgi:hypothetical protein